MSVSHQLPSPRHRSQRWPGGVVLTSIPLGLFLVALGSAACTPTAPGPGKGAAQRVAQAAGDGAVAPGSTKTTDARRAARSDAQERDAGRASEPAPAPIAAPVERGPACVAWRDRVCQALGDYHQGCRRVDEAANFLPDAACLEAMKAVPAQIAYFHTLRRPCEDLVAKLCADLGPEAQETCEHVRRKTAGFGNARCQMMLQDYGTVLEEVRSLAGARRPLTAADLAAQSGGDAPRIGPPDAPLTVIFYGDFECPFCAQMADVFRSLVQRWGKRVAFVYRSYPVESHEHAELAAEAAMAAHAQGKFWPYFDALYAKGAPLSRDALLAAARDVGLDEARLGRELDEHRWAAKVARDRALATSVGVHKTPSFLVGARRIFGTTSLDNLSTAIEEELKERQEGAGHPQPEPSAAPQ